MRRFFIAATCLALAIHASAADIAGTYSANTTLANGDTWTGGDVTINTGIIVNIGTGSTVTFNSTVNSSSTGGRILAGSGTLKIDSGGRLLIDTTSTNDNITVSGAASLINDGTYQIDCGSDFRLSGLGSSFTNNGLIHKTQGSDGSSNDPAYIYPSSPSQGGAFVNNGDIQVDAGHLNISGARTTAGAATSNGGDFTVANGATLSFTGGWTLLRGVSSMTGTGAVALTNENPSAATGGIFSALAAITILDVTGDGLLWTTGILDGNGNTLRNDGILRLTGTGAVVQGTGSVENGADGTFLLQSGTLTLTDANFTNRGTMTLETASAGTAVTLAGTGTLINAAGGTFTLKTGTLNTSTAIQNDGTLVLDSAGTLTLGGSGTLTNTATGLFSLIRGTLTLNGSQLINNGIAEFITNANKTLTGSGRFINNNTFNHVFSGSADNLSISGTVTFENNGVYDFQAGGDILFSSSGTFENNGILKKTSNTGDTSFVYGTAGFIAADGSEIQSTLGTLRLASGGTSVAGATWTANGGTLDIAGVWSGVIKGSSSSSMRITDSANASVVSELTVGLGGLSFDISGNGIVWSQHNINTQGYTLTNLGIFGTASSSTKTLTGGGEFVNASGGVFNQGNGVLTLSDNSIFRNQGTWNIAAGASYTGAGSFINDSTGTVQWTGGTLGIAPTVTYRNDGIFEITGTGTRTLANEGQLLISSTGTFNWSSGSTLTINANTSLRNEGTFNFENPGTRTINGSGEWRNASTGIVNWNTSATWSIGADVSVINDGTFNVNGTANRTISGVGTFINNGTFNLISVGSDNLVGLTSGGEFINNGLYVFGDINDFEMREGYTFTNSATGIIRKNATTSSSDPAQFYSSDGDVGAGTFDNQGTVEVLGGNFRVTTSLTTDFDDLNFVQSDGAGTLTGGTWIANATATGLATIDLEPFGNTSGLTRIGTAATVELINGGRLTQIISLTQVDGALYVQGQTFTPSAAFQVNASGTLGGDGTIGRAITVAGKVIPGGTRGTAIGTLTVGSSATFLSDALLQVQIKGSLAFVDVSLDQAARNAFIIGLGDLDPNGTQHDSLEVSGTLTFSTGTRVEVVPDGISYQSGMVFDLLDFAGLGIAGVTDADAPGILELPDIDDLGLTWDTSLFVSHGIIYITPEPSRMLLLMLGGVWAFSRRRR
ncbi:putative secreted protein with PEP-CTERM sorting signal [Prosthecobacter fusiformis]|uniref:Putative secreted protein with PEP-CTERM sorting signal n=1 Tax=Prosthecobacter fusiformis TaxID=48464 RepID=A0A4R7RIU4_9BACT|nr:PEP-CTERM sorting domain-containing protein [Prosthecobacter fusiformis]TDU63181.1 putative secreted protein with PEP-CTERM sorting signal [Prosthecobacter fusiformis]